MRSDSDEAGQDGEGWERERDGGGAQLDAAVTSIAAQLFYPISRKPHVSSA